MEYLLIGIGEHGWQSNDRNARDFRRVLIRENDLTHDLKGLLTLGGIVLASS